MNCTTQKRRGNPSGKSHETPRARAFLTARNVEHENMTDRAAVELSERIAKAEVAVEALPLARQDNANARRLLVLEERARVAVDALPPVQLERMSAALRAVLAPTLHPAPVQAEPATVRDILAAEAQLLARRRGAG